MTADSTPSTVSEALRTTCRKCHGKGTGDFGMHVKGGKCSACDKGFTFTAPAFAQVTALRLARQLAAIAQEGAALAAASPVATFTAREGRAPTEAAVQGEIQRNANALASLRADYRTTQRRIAAAQTVLNAKTVAQVRIAIWGENDSYHAAK